MNLKEFTCIQELLHDIYTEYLSDAYAPYTYGKDWILCKPSHYASTFASPWSWLIGRRERLLIGTDPLFFSKVILSTIWHWLSPNVEPARDLGCCEL